VQILLIVCLLPFVRLHFDTKQIHFRCGSLVNSVAVKLNQPFKSCYLLLKQIADARGSRRRPVDSADTTDDLSAVKLRLKLAAANVLSCQRNSTIALPTRFDCLSHERVRICVLRI
jgi:hypothetical protein